MHKVLHTPELWQLILENFAPSWEDLVRNPLDYLNRFNCQDALTDAKADACLLNLALTCRAFKEPALDILWRTMWGLTPLFKLLPGYEELINDTGKRVIIRGPILESDCKTFRSYAERIKFLAHLSTMGGTPGGIEPSAYIQLSQAIGQACLLPSLRYLICGTSSPDLHFLISPKLVGLSIDPTHMPRHLDDFWTILASLHCKAPQISYLYCDYPMSTACFQSVAKMSRLRSLRLLNSNPMEGDIVPTINQAFFESFCSLSTLSELDIAGSVKLFFNSPPPALRISFENLSTITISTPLRSIGEITDFLGLAGLPQLRLLKLSYDAEVIDKAEKVRWQNFFRHLERSTTCEFKSLIIKGKAPTSTCMAFADISAIFSLRLTDLEMPRLLRTVTCADLTTVVSSWPDLTSLAFPFPINFHGLMAIAAGLPKLKKLRNVRLQTHDLPQLAEIPVATNSLAFLSFEIDVFYPTDSYLLAAGLDRLFPCLGGRGLFTDPNKLDINGKAFWGHVYKLLDMLQSARKDQQLRDEQPWHDIPIDMI